jgi:hypothetical protein
MKRPIALTLVALPLALAAACGGGGGSKTPTSVATLSVAPTPGLDTRGEQTPTSAESTVVATEYNLVPYHHDATPHRQGSDVIDFPFDISFPAGWTVESSGVAVTASLMRTDTFPYATVSMDCRPDVDKSQMLKTDSTQAGTLSIGNLDTQPRSDLTVAGRDAIRVDWRGTGTFPADHISVYVNGKDCAWRLQLNTFGAIRGDDLSALFLRLVNAFNPAQGLP